MRVTDPVSIKENNVKCTHFHLSIAHVNANFRIKYNIMQSVNK